MISNLLSSNYKPKKTLSNNKINRNYLKNITKANPKIKPLSNVIKSTKTFNKKKINDIINNSNGIERLKKNFPTLFNEEHKKKINNKNYSKTIEKDKNINTPENKNNKVVIKSTLTDRKDNNLKKSNNFSLFSNDKMKKIGWKRNSISFYKVNSLNIDKTDRNKSIYNKKNQTNLNIYNNIIIDDDSENHIQNENKENNDNEKEEVKSQKEKKDEDEVYYQLLNNNILIVESESSNLSLSCLSQQESIKPKEIKFYFSDEKKKDEQILIDNLNNENENNINITTPKSSKNIRKNYKRSSSLKEVQNLIHENQKRVSFVLPLQRKKSLNFLYSPSEVSSPKLEKSSKKTFSKVFSSSTLNSYYDLSNNKIKKYKDPALTPLPKYNQNKNNFNQMTFQKILESTKYLRRMQYTVKVHKKNMKYFFDRRFKIIQRAWRHYFYGVKIPKIKKIQKFFRGYVFRKSNKYRMMIINKILNAFYNRIKIEIKKKHFNFLIHKLKMLVRAQKNIKDLNEIGIQVNFKIKPIVKYIENNKDEIEFNKLFNVKNLCGVKTFPRPWNEIANNGKILAKFLKKNVFDKINVNDNKILFNNNSDENDNNNKNNKFINKNLDNDINKNNKNDKNSIKNIIVNDYLKNKNYLKLLKKMPVNDKWCFITKMNNYNYIKKIIFIQIKIKSFLKKLRKKIINKRKRNVQINFFLLLLFTFYIKHIQKNIFKIIKGNFYFPFTNITISEEINESYEQRRVKMIENISYKNKKNKNNIDENKKSCLSISKNEDETEFTNLNNNRIFSPKFSDIDLDNNDKNKF